jgi:predicted DNA-binding protein (UPF0251 family)
MIEKPPIMEGFKPFGIPMRELEPVVLLFEEYESLRLADHLGLPHLKAARHMKVSRPTFTRIYEKARRTVAAALVEGKALFIEGGCYRTQSPWFRCQSCWKLITHAGPVARCPFCRAQEVRSLNPETAPAPAGAGANGHCICVHCNVRQPHQRGKPCRDTACPSCGRPMMREHGYHHQLFLKQKLTP